MIQNFLDRKHASLVKPTPNRLLAYGCLALSMSLVGSYVALTKPLAAVLPVFLLAWMRFGIGGLAMLRWLKKPADEPPLTRKTRRLLFLESFLGNFLFTLFMIYGVSLTSAVSAGVIMASIPAVVALMSWAFLRERIGLRIWGAIAFAAFGIALLALSSPAEPLPASASGKAPRRTARSGWAICSCLARSCAKPPTQSSASNSPRRWAPRGSRP